MEPWVRLSHLCLHPLSFSFFLSFSLSFFLPFSFSQKKKKNNIQLNTKKQIIQLKNGQRTSAFFQRRHTDVQYTHEKMLNITNHQGKANQNHNEISPYTSQNGWYQKDKK